MTMEMVVELARKTIETIVILSAPVLLISMAVSLVINILQVLTSVQETTISTVPRLLVTAGACFFFMPWMLRKLAGFALGLLTDLRPYLN